MNSISNECGLFFQQYLYSFMKTNLANSQRQIGQSQSLDKYGKLTNKKRQKLSIVIFDWDDTLFPTTTIINNKQDINIQLLDKFGKTLYELFKEWMKIYGSRNIYIVTNSGKDWCLKSLKLLSKMYQIKQKDISKQKLDYFAAIYNSLISLNVRIISAQYLYSTKYPKKPTIWKIKAFKQIIIEHFKNIKCESCHDNIYEIVSIGDSENEYIASYEAKHKLNKYIKRRKSTNNIIRLHRVKLKEKPQINDMIEQMKLLNKEANIMNNECGSITIRYQ